ncbi:MAG: hypothetical protein ACAI43_13045 [Phycisphaerae bacterium]|nr:hypothetical protein [Tepidisphaeraceae bacterium]
MGKKNMVIEVDTTDRSSQTCLDAAQMFLYGAEEALSRAKQKWPKVERCRKRMQALFEKEERIKRKYAADPKEMHNQLESIAIQLCDGEQYDLEQGYGVVAMECSQVHISAAAAAEAFVNSVAQERLPKQEWKAFENMNIEGKWLLLPKLLKFKGFDPGTQPHQGFAKCIKYRNGLMHHRTSWEPWEVGKVPVNSLDKLGLNVPEAEATFTAVSKMLLTAAKRTNIEFRYKPGSHATFFAFGIGPTRGGGRRAPVIPGEWDQ